MECSVYQGFRLLRFHVPKCRHKSIVNQITDVCQMGLTLLEGIGRDVMGNNIFLYCDEDTKPIPIPSQSHPNYLPIHTFRWLSDIFSVIGSVVHSSISNVNFHQSTSIANLAQKLRLRQVNSNFWIMECQLRFKWTQGAMSISLPVPALYHRSPSTLWPPSRRLAAARLSRQFVCYAWE